MLAPLTKLAVPHRSARKHALCHPLWQFFQSPFRWISRRIYDLRAEKPAVQTNTSRHFVRSSVPVVPIWNVRISKWNADLIELVHARMPGSRPRRDLCLKSALSRMSSPCFPAVFLSSSKLL
jgi:hypothetical protein